ncbi:MAG: hypothetical protein Q9160_004476 [Pyrenula sp. 1 TL-2023]
MTALTYNLRSTPTSPPRLPISSDPKFYLPNTRENLPLSVFDLAIKLISELHSASAVRAVIASTTKDAYELSDATIYDIILTQIKSLKASSRTEHIIQAPLNASKSKQPLPASPVQTLSLILFWLERLHSFGSDPSVLNCMLTYLGEGVYADQLQALDTIYNEIEELRREVEKESRKEVEWRLKGAQRAAEERARSLEEEVRQDARRRRVRTRARSRKSKSRERGT